MKHTKNYIALHEMFLAYRKAKAEAFHENTHFHAEAFTRYEQSLDGNLKRLHRRISSADDSWTEEMSFLGGFDYAPKSVEEPAADDAHFRNLNPIDDWKRRAQALGRRSEAKFRLLIAPSVDFQVISALWIIKVGCQYDKRLDQKHSYGNRLRLQTRPATIEEPSEPGINLDCQGMFKPYFSAYRTWRERGLSAMRRAIESGAPAVAVTMDIRQFYHRANPDFLIRKAFLERIGLDLNIDEKLLTRNLIAAMKHWYAATPDYIERPEGGLPVGLSASKIIANVLLFDLDLSVVTGLNPLYYGRYVDDIFLVFTPEQGVNSATELMQYLAAHTGGLLRFVKTSEVGPYLRILLPYAKDSDLIFVGQKQKVFSLTSRHGLDLIEQICEQIREQSSEHRLLPDLPETDVEMATRALLAVPDTTLESDSLRKTEAVSIRRLGFSLLLRDVEAFARDLSANRWKKLRSQFYGLVDRHLLSPKGIFDYSGYLHRVFGLMVACRDYDDVDSFLEKFSDVIALVKETTTAGTTESEKFDLCIEHYASGFVQAGLQASTSRKFSFDQQFIRLLRKVRSISPTVRIPSSLSAATNTSDKMLLADWGRRPYKDFWYFDQKADIGGPSVPTTLAVRKILRLGGIRPFRRGTSLKVPHWPALAFPTRPLTVAEISLISPGVLDDDYRFRRAVLSLRGAHADLRQKIERSDHALPHLRIPSENSKVRIALTNIETTENQWRQAAQFKPDLSLARYLSIHRLMNKVMQDHSKPNYVVVPECTLPKKWALSIAAKLAQSGISLLAGLEYQRDRKDKKLRNDCLISLATKWPFYSTNILVLQPKLAPAHGEKANLKEMFKEALHIPKGREAQLPVYVHGDFHFGVLLCSDLTSIQNRLRFQGAVDALFILEWNQDINTFSFLVESAAHDIHTFVVQVNNRVYGDSRVRTPHDAPYLRDSVRLKGGITDYFVVADIDFAPLRRFQAGGGKPKVAFKPLPIGFEMSAARRLAWELSE